MTVLCQGLVDIQALDLVPGIILCAHFALSAPPGIYRAAYNHASLSDVIAYYVPIPVLLHCQV
jgi:hypothetical protein